MNLGLVNILLLASIANANASGYSFRADPKSAKSEIIEGQFSKEEEDEKNINNVKVFYNPISQQINVSFKLLKQSVVSVKLMDALGNEVLNLSNSTLESGNQAFAFDTGDKITPGFYFLRVVAAGETVVKRISVR